MDENEARTKHLADVMARARFATVASRPIHDLSDRPVFLPTDEDLNKAMIIILPIELRGGHDLVLFVDRASNPKKIAGAEVRAACALCKEKCWLAPSSFSLVDKAAFACTHCVGTKLRAMKESGALK